MRFSRARTGFLPAIVVILVAACQPAADETEEGPLDETAGEIEEGAGEIDEAAGVDEPQRVVIEARTYAYQPSAITVDTGRPVRFIVVNAADIVHGFEVEGHGMEEAIETIEPGTTDSLEVTFDQAGEYEIYCPVADHQQREMTGTLTVVD